MICTIMLRDLSHITDIVMLSFNVFLHNNLIKNNLIMLCDYILKLEDLENLSISMLLTISGLLFPIKLREFLCQKCEIP